MAERCLANWWRFNFEYKVDVCQRMLAEFRARYGEAVSIEGMLHRGGLPISAIAVYDANARQSELFASLLSGIDVSDQFGGMARRTKFSKDSVLKALRGLAEDPLSVDRRESLWRYIDEVNEFREEIIDKRGREALLLNLARSDVQEVGDLLELAFDYFKRFYKASLPKKYDVDHLDHPLLDFSHVLREVLMRRVKYLGPLRESPRAIYPLSGDPDPRFVGLKGEFTAAVFNRFKDKVVEYISPDAILDGSLSRQKTPLSAALVDWLGYLGVVDNVDSQFRGKHGYEMAVRPKDSNGMHDLTHVGVGVSQVLPIMVMSLLSEPGDVFVFEQPELHLHPKVQSRLGDFFIALGAMRRQLVVETHSEYLIDRLRLRIAQDAHGVILSKSNIYFAEMRDGNTSFLKVEVNEYGAIIEWPSDFFDETMHISQQIISAAARKKALKKGDKK